MDTLLAPACPGHRGCGSKHSHRVWAGGAKCRLPCPARPGRGSTGLVPRTICGGLYALGPDMESGQGKGVEVTHLSVDSHWTGLETHSSVAWDGTLGDRDGECGWGSWVPLLHPAPSHGLLWVPLEPPTVPL